MSEDCIKAYLLGDGITVVTGALDDFYLHTEGYGSEIRLTIEQIDALAKIAHGAKEPPRPWLRAEEVTESGSYWWVNDASYATPVTVYVMKSGTDESCFASAGQLGWWKAMQLPALGGLWQRIPEPELPKEEA